MSDIILQTIESLSHLPQNLEHPVAAVGALALTGLAMSSQTVLFKRTEDKHSIDNYGGQALMAETLIPDGKRNRRSRLLPPRLELVGLGLVAAALVGHPTYETTLLNNQANVIIVDDMSTSMLRTHDLLGSTLTREAAVQQGIAATNYRGSLAVVQAAANSKVVLPLTKNWRSQEALLNQPQVDENGGQLVAAIDLAASLLPVEKGSTNRNGNIVILSDGAIDDSTVALSHEAQKLRGEGVGLKVVVPGTTGGSYSLSNATQQVASGANAGRFAGFGASNIAEAQSAQAVINEVKAAIDAAGTSTERLPWYPPLAIGALLAAAGILIDQIQRTRRVV